MYGCGARGPLLPSRFLRKFHNFSKNFSLSLQIFPSLSFFLFLSHTKTLPFSRALSSYFFPTHSPSLPPFSTLPFPLIIDRIHSPSSFFFSFFPSFFLLFHDHHDDEPISSPFPSPWYSPLPCIIHFLLEGKRESLKVRERERKREGLSLSQH